MKEMILELRDALRDSIPMIADQWFRSLVWLLVLMLGDVAGMWGTYVTTNESDYETTFCNHKTVTHPDGSKRFVLTFVLGPDFLASASEGELRYVFAELRCHMTKLVKELLEEKENETSDC